MNLALMRCARTAAAAVASIRKIKSSAGDIVIADGSTGPVTATKQRGAMASEMAAEHGDAGGSELADASVVPPKSDAVSAPRKLASCVPEPAVSATEEVAVGAAVLGYRGP